MSGCAGELGTLERKVKDKLPDDPRIDMSQSLVYALGVGLCVLSLASFFLEPSYFLLGAPLSMPLRFVRATVLLVFGGVTLVPVQAWIQGRRFYIGLPIFILLVATCLAALASLGQLRFMDATPRRIENFRKDPPRAVVSLVLCYGGFVAGLGVYRLVRDRLSLQQIAEADTTQQGHGPMT